MEQALNEIRNLIWGVPLIALLIGPASTRHFFSKDYNSHNYFTRFGWHISKEKKKNPLNHTAFFFIMVFVGAVVKLDLVWTFADIMNGLMALPNLIALLGLSGIVAAETRNYFNKVK